MAGKRRKHKPTFRRRSKPRVKVPDPPSQRSEPVYSEPPLIVFISSLIDKMKNERAAVDQAISSIPILRKWKFEDTPASSQPVEESYLSKVRTCDIFVLVLGSDYSKPVSHEYATALKAGKPVLVFVDKGPKDSEQNGLIATIKSKYASFSGPSDLQRLVAGSIWDELIRSQRSSISANAAPHVIQQIPLPTRKLEDLIGYFIIGLDDLALVALYKMLGATDVPPNLDKLYPTFEALPVVNVLEVNTAVIAIRDANDRSRSAHNRQKAFIRELQKEAILVASHYLKRQRTKTPEPEVTIPGINYYLWGMEQDFARLVKLLRLEEYLKEPVKITRTSPEVYFENADQFVKITSIIQEASKKAAGDIEELRRILSLEATLLAMEADEEEDATRS